MRMEDAREEDAAVVLLAYARTSGVRIIDKVIVGNDKV